MAERSGKSQDRASRIAALSTAKRTLLAQRIRGEAESPSRTPTIPRRPPHETTALSFSQERIWFLDQFEPGNPAYNRPVLLQITGPLDTAALEEALNHLLRGHEALRTVFAAVNGVPVQRVCSYEPMALVSVDLGDLPDEERENRAIPLAVQEARLPFDLARGPVLRATLYQLNSEKHWLQLVIHHIVFDAWSAGVLIDEVGQAYRAYCSGSRSGLPAPQIQYADFAHWQRHHLPPGTFDRHLSYWRQTLSGAPPSIELPRDHPRPSLQTYAGASLTVPLSGKQAQALKRLAQQESATLFMVLLAAFNVLLLRYSGQDDLVVGVPVAGRSQVETEKVIGLFINTLVLRVDVSCNPAFRELLARVRRVALEAYAHQELPFERVVEVLQPERDPSRTPLFQVNFNYKNVPGRSYTLPELGIEEIELDYQVAQFDLTLNVVQKDDGLQCKFVYNTDLFESATIERMGSQFQTLLAGLVANPKAPVWSVPVLTESERQQVLMTRNAPDVAYPPAECMHALFEAQVERTPDATAVVFEDEHLSYRQLNERSNELAHHLQRLGIGPEMLVGLHVERSLEMVVGLLSILKAGGAYLPLDPSYPTERLRFILEDAGVSVLLTQERLLARLPQPSVKTMCLDTDWRKIADGRIENPSPRAVAESAVYVIYTSGSTGQPKGVVVEHRHLYHYVLAIRETYGPTIKGAFNRG